MAHEDKWNPIHHSSYAVDYPGEKIDVSYSDENVICHALWSFHFHLGIGKKETSYILKFLIFLGCVLGQCRFVALDSLQNMVHTSSTI